MSIKTNVGSLENTINQIENYLKQIRTSLNNKGVSASNAKLSEIAGLIDKIQVASGDSRWPITGFKSGDKIALSMYNDQMSMNYCSFGELPKIYDDKSRLIGGGGQDWTSTTVTLNNDTKYLEVKANRGCFDSAPYETPVMKIKPAGSKGSDSYAFEIELDWGILDDLLLGIYK